MLKKIILVIFLIYVFWTVFDFITSPHIKTINHTNAPIRFRSLQYVDIGEEPTTEELNDWKTYYHIKKSGSGKMKLYEKHRFSEENIYFDLSYKYTRDYLNEDNTYDLKGVALMNKPAFLNQSAYCAFKVDVYPNRKTIVTPTRKWGCINPMYYHKSSLEDNN